MERGHMDSTGWNVVQRSVMESHPNRHTCAL